MARRLYARLSAMPIGQMTDFTPGDFHSSRAKLSSGSDLPGVAAGSIDAIWSFDVFVQIAPRDHAACWRRSPRFSDPGAWRSSTMPVAATAMFSRPVVVGAHRCVVDCSRVNHGNRQWACRGGSTDDGGGCNKSHMSATLRLVTCTAVPRTGYLVVRWRAWFVRGLAGVAVFEGRMIEEGADDRREGCLRCRLVCRQRR